ncbi:Glycosyl transferases group 1 [Desulfonauticus submarinus]|uniref:Glycosyl transferases group 1 n=1 Tax=Desulfonauticus submarinus TaxID=206665 RepID=A0A1H0D6K1_9BACT|nr:glycosyltransferase [Desulfonauticus submarinus]SDN65792.1 Glycosyl transferases group 1 [Desulfonauticus submarinus]
MRILTINCSLNLEFSKVGEVFSVNLPGGIIDLAKYPGALEFKPELIFHQENLGPRTLLIGLDKFHCPKVFWSIDTHLNFFWHKYYGKNYDIVFSAQPHWVDKFQEHNIHAEFLPWYVEKNKWISWSLRKHQLCFVGRISQYRPIRKRLINFLKQNFSDFIFKQDIGRDEMFCLYQQSKIVVNECIAGDLNFRFFEAMGNGALLVTPNLPCIDLLFEPEKEFVSYTHGLELRDKLKFYIKNDLKALSIARNGYEKSLKCHLAEHRVRKILSCVQDIESKKLDELEVYNNTILSLYFLSLNGINENCENKIDKFISTLPRDNFYWSLLLEVFIDKQQKLKELLDFLLLNKIGERDLELNAIGSEAALRLDNLRLAKLFLLRYVKGKNIVVEKLNSIDIHLFWAKEFLKEKRILRQGFLFDSKKHFPRAALEFIYLALEENQNNEQVLHLARVLAKKIAGQENFLLKVESWLSLLEPNNWRLNLDLVLTNLKNFRLKEAEEELYLAYENAKKQGEESLFWLRKKAILGEFEKAFFLS